MFIRAVDAAHERLMAAIPRARPIVDDFALKSSPAARAKALARLRSLFVADATFMFATTDRPNPLAGWAYLRHRDAATWAAHDAHERDRQECVVINFLVAGRLPNGQRFMNGRWSLEFSYHCLARLFSPQRSPLALTPLETIWRAHEVLLRGSAEFLHSRQQVRLPVGDDGALVIEIEAPEVDGHPHAFVIARSWLPAHMRSWLEPLPVAADLADALGAVWLCPEPLWQFRADGLVDIPDCLAQVLVQ
jgi:hypothetical protein